MEVNQPGVVDINGIGQNAGASFPLGTYDSTDYGSSSEGANSHGGVGRGTGGGKGQTVGNVLSSTTDDYLKNLMKLSQSDPSKFAAIQQGLYNSGFYGSVAPGDVGFGRWSQKTQDALLGPNGALTNFLQLHANGATAKTFDEWLGQEADLASKDPNSPGNKPGSGGAALRAPITYTDPSTLDNAGNTESSQFLGHAMDAGQQGQFVSQFQGNEKAQYDAQGQAITGKAGDTGTATRQQNPADAAKQFVVDNNLPEYAAHQAEGFMNVFANMFLSGNSSRAQTSLGDVAVGGAPTTPAPAGA
jgi:hypothetical protein